jgi:hypothetical protein
VRVSDLFQLISDSITLPLGDGSERSQKTKMGKLLAEQRERVYRLESEGGEQVQVRIMRGRDLHNSAQWNLERLVVDDNNCSPCIADGEKSLYDVPKLDPSECHVPQPSSQPASIGSNLSGNVDMVDITNMGDTPYTCTRTPAPAHVRGGRESPTSTTSPSPQLNGFPVNGDQAGDQPVPRDAPANDYEEYLFDAAEAVNVGG